MKFLIYGWSGWIGSMIVKLLEQDNETVFLSKVRSYDYMSVMKEVEDINPDFVLNVAGITGKPTVDYCEDHKQDTYLTNTIGTINIADVCWRKGIHVTYYGTGCIYTYDYLHQIGTSFSEKDEPNFDVSTYSKSKLMAEKLLSVYDNVLTLRIRLPISGDMHPKCIISKLSKYSKIIKIPNSFSVLPELLPISIDMTKKKLTGIYNFTNPGACTHDDILKLYKKHVDPNINWEIMSLDEQNSMLKTKRCNCALDSSKLEALYPLTNITTAIEKILVNLSETYY
jgi:dTDP-4-dehydrorhamnose reductase